jgi:transcriptional regulator with PAS, ATPase and Fis domain
MNLNTPFGNLPPSALDICVTARELSDELFYAGRKMDILLSTVEFFKPLFLLYENPVLLIDQEGRILTANAPMRSYCPDWDNFSYGTQSLEAYLGKSSTLQGILALQEKLDAPQQVYFRSGKKRREAKLDLIRRSTVKLDGQAPFIVCVFEEANSEPVARTTHNSVTLEQIGERLPVGLKTIDYIGESDEWKEVDTVVQKIAPIKAHVLLLGETGTGKEVVARALHRRSKRTGEFVAINCGAVPHDLLATELFGYEGGAFTGARESGAMGKFEYANNGTLFLDEIAEMPTDMQVSLLRVLQEQSVTKLGSNTTKQLDVRVIAATNQDIEKLIAEKKFRSDLYYRLSLIEIRLPQLRRRTSDVPLLIDYFNQQFSQLLNLPCTSYPNETLQVLKRYSWPGNVRELKNFIERSLIMQGEGAKVTLNTLPTYLANASNNDLSLDADSRVLGSFSAIDTNLASISSPAITREALIALAEHHDDDLHLVAKDLNILSKDLSKILNKFGLEMRIVAKEPEI